MDIVQQICRELDEERQRQGMSYYALANRLDKGAQSGIMRLLAGEYPNTSLAEVAKVAAVLGKRIVLK